MDLSAQVGTIFTVSNLTAKMKIGLIILKSRKVFKSFKNMLLEKSTFGGRKVSKVQISKFAKGSLLGDSAKDAQ